MSATSMDKMPGKFPFPSGFLFREDERTGLEALFSRAFFDATYSTGARESLGRTRFLPADPVATPSPRRGKEAPPPKPAAPPSPPATFEGDAARFILLYRGADGIGKTRVFRQFRESARGKQIPVYEVYHHDVEGIPFKPFLHAIRAILSDHDRGAALVEKYAYGLRSILPELYAVAEEGPSSEGRSQASGSQGGQEPWKDPTTGEAEKVRTFDAITQLLIEVSTERPLLILVHDLHWSDRPTIELLDYIGRNLQLRRSPSLQPHSRAQGPDAMADLPTGPELDDFDSQEWRKLSRSAAPALDLLGVHYYAFPPTQPPDAQAVRGARLDEGDDGSTAARPREAGATGAGSRAGEDLRPRLMVLGNYRGFRDAAHYLEQGLRDLGEQPFSYHGELRPLSRVEADRFIQKCLEGVQAGDRELHLTSDAVDAVYEASEGFPSFMQELFRAIYLGEGSFGSAPTPADAWSAQSIRAALGAVGLPGAAGPQEDDPVHGQRHAILKLRLSGASDPEKHVLQAMAVARRPVRCALLTSVLGGAEPVAQALAALEERGIVERHGEGDPGEGPYFFFRLWDYASVVTETIPPDDLRALHQRVGEEYRRRLAAGTDEGAYEVYYHLRRGTDARESYEFGLLAARRFKRSFALVKTRQVYTELLDLAGDGPEALSRRLSLLEDIARISLALKEGPAAEDALKRAQAEGGDSLGAERRVEMILLEAEAARLTDAAKGLKILGKTSKHLKDENCVLGIRLQLATARLRLERQDTKRAINFCLKGASLAQKVGDVPELGDLYRVMASAFYRKGDYSHAVDNYQRGLEAFERMGLRDASVGALDDLGRVYLERGNYFRAARYLYKALEIRRRSHDLPGLCRSYDELGRVYLRSGDYLKTIENLNRSLALKERIGDFAGLNPTLVILGDLYFRLGRYEQALAYFRREVDNSQKLGDTRGLVEAFAQLARVHFELGDLKQAESLSKQVSILASEFKLRSQEADGALVEGNIRALNRDWPGAEKNFKLAAEVHGKLGHRRREVSAHLDLAEVKVARELYEDALKAASKGHLIADEVKAMDLQGRALVIKGNIHRFLKGGNVEKARESFHKALELSQGLSDVHVLFQLYYSLAKLCHSTREFPEAASYYGKAEQIIKQIGDGLTEDRAARYFEDKRRKVFAEDAARFKKDALGRASGAPVDSAVSSGGAKDRPVGFADYKDLTARALRLHQGLNQLHFHDRLLAEAVELTGADRGFILRVQNRQYFPVAFSGFGKNPGQHPELQAASNLAQEAVRRGRSVLASGFPDPARAASKGEKRSEGEPDLDERGFQLSALSHRSVLAVPFMTDERIFGGVYLDKPIVVGQFLPRDQVLLEAFAQHAAAALANRREFETAIREPLTGFFTASYFIERLREAFRFFNLHGKSFALLGYYVPTLEDVLGEGRGELARNLARDLAEALPPDAAVAWGTPVLCVLLSDADLAVQDEVAARARDRLAASLGEEVPMAVLPAQNRYQSGAEIYFELRRKLLPEVSDRKVLSELRGLLAPDISLRDAKTILEKHKIEMTLRKTGGNITHAATELGIHRPQLSNLLKKHALKRELFEGDVNGDEVAVSAEPSDN